MNTLKVIYHGILFLTCALSLYYAFRYSGRRQGYFAFYLLFVQTVELSVVYFSSNEELNLNGFIYNMYFLGSLAYFTFFYYLICKTPLFRKITILLFVIFLFIYYQFIPDDFFSLSGKFAVRSNLVMQFAFIWMCLVYFLDVIAGTRNMKMSNTFGFWITMGVFIWSVMSSLRFAGMHYFNENNKLFLSQMDGFLDILNIITYSLYLKALLCLIPQKT